MNNVYVLGSINYDLVIRAPYYPKAGETMHGGGFMTNAGGKGANQAVAAAKLGAKTFLIGAAGGDLFGAECLAGLKSYGVDTRFVQTIEGVNTGVAVITVVGGDNRIILDGGANMKINQKTALKVIKDNLKKGDILVTQLEVDLELVHSAHVAAKENGARVIHNPAPAVKLSKDFLKYVDIIVPNECEAEILTGENTETDDGIRAAAGALSAAGVKEVIITLGSRGCAYYLLGSDEVQFFPACKVKAVDTTAAGDTFIGALAMRFALGDTARIFSFCQAAAAITVTRKGAQASIPYLNEVKL